MANEIEAEPGIEARLDWSKHPFWANPEGLARHLGEETARAVVDNLQRLFPAAFCRALPETPERRGFLCGLFFPELSHFAAPMAMLGLDLVQCAGWADKPNLMTSLQHHEHHHSARVEVGVWAGLVRAGLGVEYEPAGDTGTAVDLLVHEDGSTIALEIKAAYGADRARNRQLLESFLHEITLFDRLCRQAHGLRVVLAEVAASAVENLPTYSFTKKLLAEIEPQFTESWTSQGASLAIGDDLVIPGIGTLYVGPSPSADTRWPLALTDWCLTAFPWNGSVA